MRQTILFISCDEIPGHVKKGSQITLGHFHGQMFLEKTCSSPIQGPGQESSFRVTSLVGRFNIRFPLYWSQGFSFMSESQKTSPIHFHPQPCLLPSPSLTGMGQCQQRRWSCQGQHAPWLFISLSVDTSNNISYFLVSSAGLWYNPATRRIIKWSYLLHKSHSDLLQGLIWVCHFLSALNPSKIPPCWVSHLLKEYIR